ncbi:hypothetical protein RSAG8_08081, partial [Rhizoctonia solani AG-8 WAC10335]
MSESILPVAIIGAGLGGIATGIALQTQLGCYDYQVGSPPVLFDRYSQSATDLRDVEWDRGNLAGKYVPGLCVRRSMSLVLFSLSTELNPNWSQLYVGYKEIRSYWERVAAKHDIVSHIQFFTEVLSLVWDEGTQAYIITCF